MRNRHRLWYFHAWLTHLFPAVCNVEPRMLWSDGEYDQSQDGKRNLDPCAGRAPGVSSSAVATPRVSSMSSRSTSTRKNVSSTYVLLLVPAANSIRSS